MRGSEPGTGVAGAAHGAPADESTLLLRLAADGFVRRVDDHFEPAPRWRAAMARAAYELNARGDELTDLRVPVAWVLAESYAGKCTDDELVGLVHVMTRLETGAA